MNLLWLARYWQYIAIVALSLLIVFMTFMLRDASNTMQLMQANHDLWKANYIAKTNQDIIEIQRLNSERYHNAVSENTKAYEQIADSYTANSAVVASLSDTIDTASSAYISANADARAEYTAAISNVSRDCVGEIAELARRADGHVADIKMMQQAWPK